MSKKIFSFTVFTNLLVITLFLSIGSTSESASDYYSIHQDVAVTYTQYNTDPTTGVITTTDESKQYNDFLNLYNLNDTIIACGTQDDPSGCTITDEETWLPTIVWGAAGTNPALSSNARFKVFIPPGALQINLYMFTQFQPSVKAVVRFDQVPDCVNCTASQTTFTQEGTFFFEEFETEDVHLQNAGGHIDIYSKSLQAAPNAFSAAPAITQGGWLYVYVYDQADAVGMIQYAVKVDTALYTDWYDNYDKTNDIYGLAAGSTTTPTTPVTTLNTLTGTITDTTTGLPASNISLFAVNYSDPGLYSATTDVDGIYLIDKLKDGDYLLFAKSSGSQVFISNQTATIYSLVSGITQTVNFDFDSQLSISPSQTFDDGKNYCIENPDLCNIVTIENNYNIQLNSVKIPGLNSPNDPNSQNRYDIELQLKSLWDQPDIPEWELDLTDPNSFLLSTPTT